MAVSYVVYVVVGGVYLFIYLEIFSDVKERERVRDVKDFILFSLFRNFFS